PIARQQITAVGAHPGQHADGAERWSNAEGGRIRLDARGELLHRLQKGIEGPAFEVGLNRRWSDAGLLKEIEVHKEANGGDVVGKTIEPALIAVGIDRPLGEIGEVVLVALDVR